jgi:hypothetical protein
VLTHAYEEQRIAITNDKGDFGKLIFKNFHPHAGVILFRRMKPGDMQAKLDRLTYVLSTYANRLNHFLVVTPTNVRVKKIPTQKAAQSVIDKLGHITAKPTSYRLVFDVFSLICKNPRLTLCRKINLVRRGESSWHIRLPEFGLSIELFVCAHLHNNNALRLCPVQCTPVLSRINTSTT